MDHNANRRKRHEKRKRPDFLRFLRLLAARPESQVSSKL